MRDLLGRMSDYKIGRPLGRGARSVIYKMKHRKGDSLYAGKFVCLKDKADRKAIKHLKNENKVLSALTQTENAPPQIVRRHDFFSFRKFFFLKGACLLLEYVSGTSLQANPDYTLTEIIDIMAKVCRALTYVHKNDYVHADLKPDNIIVNANNEVKIIDFGFATPIGSKTKGAKGTTGYLAPEQTGGLLGPSTDVYNIGGAMYWLTTGENLPYVQGNNSAAAAASSHTVDPTPPHHINHKIPRDLSRLILQCCAHQKEDRPTMPKLAKKLHDVGLRIKMQD